MATTNIVTMKMCEVLRELSKCDTDAKQANAVGIRAPTDWPEAGLPQTLDLQKMQYLKCNKRSAVK